MPENGVVQIPHEEILTYDEITRISRCMTGLGIRKIKLTGGEPLIRKNCATLVRMLKERPGIEKVTLTTNGVLLEEQIADLAEAGLDDINISLDTLNAAFEKLLDSLFQDTAWDVSSDISVLHTMLAQEGLTEDGLKK